MRLEDLINANASRVERWHSVNSWSPLEWAGVMAGEVGETCNIAKKLKRLSDKIPNIDNRLETKVSDYELKMKYEEQIGDEVADTIIYGILLCLRVDVNLI